MINLDMACGACAYALNAIDTPAGLVFEHPVTPREDHQPIPVPAHRFATVYRRCHLCSIHQPIWQYRTDAMEAVADDGAHPITQTYSTCWHVCCECADLIEAGDHTRLTHRCATVMGWTPGDARTRLLAGIHHALMLARAPGRALLTTGTWTSTPLKAPALPKIRDRLTGLLRGPVGLPEPLHTDRGHLAHRLEQARLYWIDPEFTALVAETSDELPRTTVTDRIVPAGSGLLCWASPVDDRHRLTAASWRPHGDGWDLTCYRSYGPDLPTGHIERLRHDVGWLIPAHHTHLAAGAHLDGSDPLAALAATWLIIAQQLTSTESVPADPPIRRAYTRRHRPAPEIRIIRIRPTAVPPPTHGGDRTPTGRARPDHRYWVSGHTRKQAYGPGRSLRREVDIDPFLKGPPDAPIKASTTVRILGSQRTPSPGDN
jgi:hypothetical protein